MYGLTGTLSTASNALNADSGAISVTNNNIANVNTPGYSRQLVNLSPSVLSSAGGQQDNGVSLGQFTSVRDSVLQLAINQKTSDLSSQNLQSATWTQLGQAFSGTDSGLGAAISNFFSDSSALSTAPTDPATRQTAFSAANALADAFHQSAASLSDAQSQANQGVLGSVEQINQLTSQIAALDQQLQQTTTGEDGGALQDQRDTLTQQLASLTGLSVISTESTPTLALANGTPLVLGSTAYALTTTTDTAGHIQILDAQGTNITGQITGGTLGAAITLRDQAIPAVQQTLNQLASQLATALNAAQTQGYSLAGVQGTAMFTLPTGVAEAAAQLTLNLSTSADIAISSDGTRGSSGNLANILSVQTAALPSGMPPIAAYASLVQQIGSNGAAATSQATATSASLNQLLSKQSSESGVSVDEETTNLLRYQQAYSAAAQVISTINTLFSIVLNMGTVTG